jgi:hypothetical protein
MKNTPFLVSFIFWTLLAVTLFLIFLLVIDPALAAAAQIAEVPPKNVIATIQTGPAQFIGVSKTMVQDSGVPDYIGVRSRSAVWIFHLSIIIIRINNNNLSNSI